MRLDAGRLVVRTGICHEERLHVVRVRVFPGPEKLEVHPREGRSAVDTVDLGALPPGWTTSGKPPGPVVADRRYTVEVVRDRALTVTVPGDVLLGLPMRQVGGGRLGLGLQAAERQGLREAPQVLLPGRLLTGPRAQGFSR